MFLNPDYIYDSVHDIDFKKLQSCGILLLIFDLDSTIMVSKSARYDKKTFELLDKLNKIFKICVMSNNKNDDYIEQVRKISCFDIVGKANKPNPKAINEYLKQNSIDRSQTVIIGDRPLTDILVGKLCNIKTILVDSINKEYEPKLTRFVRWLERLTIKKV